MIHEMIEKPEKTANAASNDKSVEPKDKTEDPDPFCCTPPDNDPGPIGG